MSVWSVCVAGSKDDEQQHNMKKKNHTFKQSSNVFALLRCALESNIVEHAGAVAAAAAGRLLLFLHILPSAEECVVSTNESSFSVWMDLVVVNVWRWLVAAPVCECFRMREMFVAYIYINNIGGIWALILITLHIAWFLFNFIFLSPRFGVGGFFGCVRRDAP